eukprot:jgi/Bigna1/86719/estExt_fgenesh1_pg.C_130047
MCTRDSRDVLRISNWRAMRPPANWLPNEGFSDLYLRFIPGESRQDEGVLLKLYALQAMSPLGRGRCGWREASASNCNDGGYVSAKSGDVVVGRMHPPPSSCLPARAMSPQKPGMPKFHQRKFCGWPLSVLRKDGLLDKLLTEKEDKPKQFQPVTRIVDRGLQHQERVVLEWLETFMEINQENGKAQFKFKNNDRVKTMFFDERIAHIHNVTGILVSRIHDRLRYDQKIKNNKQNGAHFEELLERTDKYFLLMESTCSKRNMLKQ